VAVAAQRSEDLRSWACHEDRGPTQQAFPREPKEFITGPPEGQGDGGPISAVSASRQAYLTTISMDAKVPSTRSEAYQIS